MVDPGPCSVVSVGHVRRGEICTTFTRLIGSIRRECVDHVVVLGETHLSRILTRYSPYYNEVRTHRSLDKDAPINRAIQHAGRVISVPVLGGLQITVHLDARQTGVRGERSERNAAASGSKRVQYARRNGDRLHATAIARGSGPLWITCTNKPRHSLLRMAVLCRFADQPLHQTKTKLLPARSITASARTRRFQRFRRRATCAQTNSRAPSIVLNQFDDLWSPSAFRRARSAVVMPDTGLPPGSPCQAPSLLWSPPALKQATRAFRLAGDRIAIGAHGSFGASSTTGEGEISSLREAGSTALS